MYWKLEEAVIELKRRQQGQLMMAVDAFLGENCPIPKGFNGFLARPIANARIETIEFEKRCKAVGLKPFALEYTQDIFLANNPDKMNLVRLYVYLGRGKRGGDKLKRIDLVDYINRFNGIPLSSIKTKKGELLVDFHHRACILTGLQSEIIDLSAWLKSIGPADKYYPYFLAGFLTRGILFESFDVSGFPQLKDFKERVVIPAWEDVANRFEAEPLIVYHPQCESPDEERRILNFYPPEIIKVL
jgi:hypothetical protein